MTSEAERAIRRRGTLHGKKSVFMQHWQDLADLMLPRRAIFITQVAPGEKRTNKIYDGTSQQAAQMLAAAIDGFIKSKSSRWFKIEADDAALNEDDEAKGWFRDTEDRMFGAIYNPKAKFTQRTGEVDLDLSVFGTGGLLIDEVQSLGRLRFRSLHLKDIAIVENGDGDIDTIYIDWMFTAQQAAQRFGEENLGEKGKDALSEGSNNHDPDKELKYLQVIEPQDIKVINPEGMTFRSRWFEVDSKEKVGEGSFFEFPVVIPRWDTSSGEVYGRSQGMIALPDAGTSNAIGKTLLVAGQKAVDPPLWVNDDTLAGSAPLTFPGGVNYFDAEAVKDLQGGKPFFALDTGANIPLGREMQNDTRELIWAAFLRNVLRLPVDGPQMTATEIIERKEEFIRTVGPFLGRLEADYTAPMVNRVFGIMLRAGAFLEPPDVLAGRDVKFVFASPIEKVRQQIEIAAALRTLEQLGPFIEIKPEILDNFDFDAISRDMMDLNDAPIGWVLPQQAVAALREARARAQQEAQQMAAIETAADAAAKVGGIPGVPELAGLPVQGNA